MPVGSVTGGSKGLPVGMMGAGGAFAEALAGAEAAAGPEADAGAFASEGGVSLRHPDSASASASAREAARGSDIRPE